MGRIILTSLALLAGARADLPAVHRLVDAIRQRDRDRVVIGLDEIGAALPAIRLPGGVTLLHVAAASDAADVARMLIRHGARLDAVTDGGFTALHWAAARDAAATVQVLLDAGAYPDAEAGAGITPLHWAAARNATNAVARLLRVGANPMSRTGSQLTPLHWAVSREREAAALMLALSLVRQNRDDDLMTDRPEPIAPIEGAGHPAAPAPDRPPQLAAPAHAAPVVIRTEPDRPLRRQGDTLALPIGNGQALNFVWLERKGVWFGMFEVTNAQFRRFRPMHDSGRREGVSLDGDALPVVRVSWHDAAAFCEWVNAVHAAALPPGFACRLPSDAEWRHAASGNDARRYPWGDAWPPTVGNHADASGYQVFPEWRAIPGFDDGFPATCPVTESGANEWGIHGLAGNVWEWCADIYGDDPELRVRQGGGWDDKDPVSLEIEVRGFDAASARYDTIGFRVVLAPSAAGARPGDRMLPEPDADAPMMKLEAP